MSKYKFILSLIAVVLLIGASSGCDNRSQLEKDADAAAKKVNQMMK